MQGQIKYIISAAVIFILLMPLRTNAGSGLNIYVSILPQKYFVEKIAGNIVNIDVLVKPGKSPATYSPSPLQIKKLLLSDVYFKIGVPFENGILNKIKSISGMMVVDTRQGIVLRKMGEDHHHTTENNLLGQDPHIWMNPLMVKKQSHTIFKTLSQLDPVNKNRYKKNFDAFAKELDALDHYITTILKDFKDHNIFVFHPSFGYFTDAYGLKQIAVETMGKAPKGKTLSKIIKLAKKQKIRIIFVQPQFDRTTAEKIASVINGSVISIDPLAYDYPANMKNIAHSIASVLKK